MSNIRPFPGPESRAGAAATPAQRATDALLVAIERAREALDAAAEEAAKGMLGAAKLGLMVAATGIIDALKAADAEFARRYAADSAEGPDRQPNRHDSQSL
jgi:hypothetical protein